MSIRSTIPIVNPQFPDAWARDDITGLPVMHGDLVKQMEYRGNNLVWTGFMVHYKDMDEPNAALVPPKLKPDPVPVENPRIFQMSELPETPTGLTVSNITQTTADLNWNTVTDATSYQVTWGYSTQTPSTYFVQTGITGTSLTLSGLGPNTLYFASVASVNAIGSSAYSPLISIKTLAVP